MKTKQLDEIICESNKAHAKTPLMKHYLINLGHIKAVIAITIASVLFSLIVTLVIELLLSHINKGESIFRGMLVATFVSLIVAPIMGWYFVNILMKVHRLEEEMRALATYDELTGLLRRHAFLVQSDYFYKFAKRTGLGFCIAIVDMDNFKTINDTYGHATGDTVLVSFSKAVRANFRKSDFVSRFGGDEFVFFLPDTSLDQALIFTERLHACFREENEKNGLPIEATVSIGLVTNKEVKTDNIEEVINAADNALYCAKKNGGNQTQIYRADIDR